MNRPRLERLIKVLEQVPESAFNMDVWGFPDSHNECGTVCCACGHAAMDPELNSQGLSLKVRHKDHTTTVCETYGDLATAESSPIAYVTIAYMHHRSFEAASTFFDIYLGQAEDLFAAVNYPSPNIKPRDVISKIQQLLDEDSTA